MALQLTPLRIPNMTVDYSAQNQALAGLGELVDRIPTAMQKQRDMQTLGALGEDIKAGNYAAAAQKAVSLGRLDAGAQLLALGQKAGDRDSDNQLLRGILGGGAASAPAASGGTAPSVAVGNPTEIENRFMSGIRGAGLNNPYGLGAVAAYGRAESGFSPQNANRVWSDPSESGQPGNAGGIMSWRADRLQNLYNFARQNGEDPKNISPEIQAAFLVSEDPQLLPRLQQARSPEEANQIMANAWRFAGYDRPGGENARRLAMTRHYSGRYGTEMSGNVPVAMNEEAVQAQEARMAGGGQPVQMAQAPATTQADVPAQGAQQAQGFVIPSTGETIDQQTIASNPRIQRMVMALGAAKSDQTRAVISKQLELEIADIKQKQSQTAPTEAMRNYRFYRQEEQAAGRKPMSFQEFRESTANRQTVNVGGGSDKQIFDTIKEGADAAQTAVSGLQSIREARRAVEGGGYFGAGADLKLGLQKTAAALGIANPDTLGKIVNTETFRSAIAPQVAATMKATVGSTQISNADREFAEKAAGGAITLDEKSIGRLLGIMEKANRAIIERHNKRLDTVYPEEGGKFARERALFGVQAPEPEPEAPPPQQAPPAPQQRSQAAPMGAPTATGPNGQRVIWNGQAWVPMT